MTNRLPPLTALRAFDAAARHMSFARAADELNVTPAALSFQIKSLEDHLGQPVFRRLNRAIELTEAGRVLAPGCADGFAALGAAWRNTKRLNKTKTLTVTAGPAFTAKWLAPRLFSFANANPDIQLRFSAGLRLVDLERDEIDVAIRFGQRDFDDLYQVTIIEEWLTPMMTPDLARRITVPSDMRGSTLIHQEDISFLDPPMDWAAWFAAAGVEMSPRSGPRFSQADHAIDAALSGAGVVLGRISLTETYLRDGRLVAPFATSLWAHSRYRIVCRQGVQNRPQVARFINWVKQEVSGIAEMSCDRQFANADPKR